MKHYTDCSFVNTSAEFDKKLSQAPGNKFPREAIQNGIEAYLYSKKSSPRKEIKVFKVHPDLFFPFTELFKSEGIEKPICEKLVYHNFGDGMDAKKLRTILNGASSGDEKKMATTDNHGEGATITGLASNSLGLVYISCCDKKVSLAWLRIISTSEGLRLPVKHNFFGSIRESNTGFEDVVDITNEDCFNKLKLELDHDDLFDISNDWTAVIALGDNPNQKTYENPYASDKGEPGYWLQKDIFNRYFRFPEGISIKIFGGCGQSRLKNVFLNINSYEDEINDALEEKNKTGFEFEWVTDDITGIKIGYVFDPDDRGTKARRVLARGSSFNSYSAIIYKNECYSARGDGYSTPAGTWKSIAPACGITVANENFKILVELPVNIDIVPSSWRKGITYKTDPNRTEIDFGTVLSSGERICDTVKRNMPQWMKDKLKELDKSLVDNSSRQADFQKKLEDMIKPQLAQSGHIPGTQVSTGGAGNKSGNGNYTQGSNGIGSGHGNGSGGTGNKKTRFTFKTGQDLEVAPQFPQIKTVTDDEEWIGHGGGVDLKGKAAWYDTDNELLYINGNYNVVEIHAQRLLNEVPSEHPDIDDTAKKLAREAMEDRVCWHILNGLAKKATTSGWASEEISQSWNPMALTVGAADIIYANDSEYRKKMKEARNKLENKVYED
jgi:RES domain-containing protein